MTDADRLRAAGLRVTSARVAVLDAARTGDHPDTGEVTRAVRARVRHVTVQAVYEALHALTAAGLVRRIQPAGGPARFEEQSWDNHHHLVCRSCGAVADVACVVGHAPCLAPASRMGYTIDDAEVTLWGRCARCNGAAAAPPISAGDDQKISTIRQSSPSGTREK